MEISDEEFSQLIAEVMDELPKEHIRAMENVAIVMAEEPTPEQREQLKLQHGQTLFGLFEGVPRPQKGGRHNTFMPDKITIFKRPMLEYTGSYTELKDEVKHTLWHEIAHYFGLDHAAIARLEKKRS